MIDNHLKIEMLRKMILIRMFEDAVSEYRFNNCIYGGAHCYNGEEAVAVGVCSALKLSDYIISNHRPHGHAIAKGMDPKKIMAEIFGKSTGSNVGKGGSMHVHDVKVGLIASSGIVGSGIPVGCGAAYAAKFENSDRISCVFFGDGSANEGVLHECLNLASVWDLPILFLLEDNSLAITTNTRESSACNDYVKLASAYQIDGLHVDGQDVEAVYNEACETVHKIRKSSRPFLIQAHTIRFNEHAEAISYKKMIDKKYRDYDQLEKDKKERCPIKLYISKLIAEKVLTDSDIQRITAEVKAKIEEYVSYSIASAEPDWKQATTDVFREVLL